jgi:hypothetical protein
VEWDEPANNALFSIGARFSPSGASLGGGDPAGPLQNQLIQRGDPYSLPDAGLQAFK